MLLRPKIVQQGREDVGDLRSDKSVGKDKQDARY